MTVQTNLQGGSQYNFIDPHPLNGQNYYRLRLVDKKNQDDYSNTVLLTKKKNETAVRIYPNPVSEFFSISIGGNTKHMYKVTLLNMVNQVVSETTINAESQREFKVIRSKKMSKGLYVLKCVDLKTGDEYTQKLIFL